MIKITGCILVFISCTTIGFLKSISYKERTAELQNIIEILKLMNMEIIYKREPLVKTFRCVAALKQCWFSEVLQCCSSRLAEQCPLHETWQEVMDEKKIKCPLHDRDINVLNDMVLGLGRSDAAGQQKVLEAALLRLRGCLEEAEEQEQKQGKMYCSLGAAAGVIAAVVLI